MSQDEFMKLFKEVQKVNRNLELHTEASHREHAEINGAIGELGGQIETIIKK